MDENKIHIRELRIPSSIDDEKRSVIAELASENPVLVSDWERGLVDEILVMSGAILPEDNVCSLVDTHNYGSVKQILGSIIDLKIEGDVLVGDVRFSSIASAEWTKLKEGHIRKLSIGYQINKVINVLAGESCVYNGKTYTAGERDLRLVIEWELYEGSLVTLPADNSTNFRNKTIENPNKNGGCVMAEEVKTEETKIEEKTDVVTIEEIRKESDDKVIAKRERERIATIRSAAKDLGIEDDVAEKLIEDEVKLDEARQILIAKAGERSKMVETKATITKDSVDNVREACELALSVRSGVKVEPKQIENLRKSEYNGFGFADSARSLCDSYGIRTVMKNEAVINYVLSKRDMNVTSDYVNILANVATKILRQAYNEAPTTYQMFCAKDELPDFKTADLPQLSPFSSLDEIAEGAPFTEGTFLDSKEQAQLKTFGKMFNISRQLQINDDTRAFSRILLAMGRSAARNVNKKVYGLINTNGLMADGNALFSVAHGNLAAAPSVPSVVSIGAGLQAMMNQKSNNELLGIAPQYIIVGPSLAVETEQLISSVYDPAATNGKTVVNPFGTGGRWKLQLVVDPLITDDSWYLAASPADIGTITVFTLAGYDAPTLRSEDSRVGAALGISFDVYHDVAVGAEDYKGLYKNGSNSSDSSESSDSSFSSSSDSSESSLSS